jgi:protein-S-isoprenylcysteine O-methyltransferase Ste14
MTRNANEFIPAILNGVSGIGIFLISFLVDWRFPMSKATAKPLGMLIVAAGMALVIWAAVHIKRAFLGEVEPRLEILVQNGPYRFIRHPVYLGMTIAIAGLTIALRSWLGLIGVFLLFLPSEIYRAKLEERALLHKFGGKWENYKARTGFILPSSRRR